MGQKLRKLKEDVVGVSYSTKQDEQAKDTNGKAVTPEGEPPQEAARPEEVHPEVQEDVKAGDEQVRLTQVSGGLIGQIGGGQGESAARCFMAVSSQPSLPLFYGGLVLRY